MNIITLTKEDFYTFPDKIIIPEQHILTNDIHKDVSMFTSAYINMPREIPAKFKKFAHLIKDKSLQIDIMPFIINSIPILYKKHRGGISVLSSQLNAQHIYGYKSYNKIASKKDKYYTEITQNILYDYICGPIKNYHLLKSGGCATFYAKNITSKMLKILESFDTYTLKIFPNNFNFDCAVKVFICEGYNVNNKQAPLPKNFIEIIHAYEVEGLNSYLDSLRTHIKKIKINEDYLVQLHYAARLDLIKCYTSAKFDIPPLLQIKLNLMPESYVIHIKPPTQSSSQSSSQSSLQSSLQSSNDADLIEQFKDYINILTHDINMPLPEKYMNLINIYAPLKKILNRAQLLEDECIMMEILSSIKLKTNSNFINLKTNSDGILIALASKTNISNIYEAGNEAGNEDTYEIDNYTRCIKKYTLIANFIEHKSLKKHTLIELLSELELGGCAILKIDTSLIHIYNMLYQSFKEIIFYKCSLNDSIFIICIDYYTSPIISGDNELTHKFMQAYLHACSILAINKQKVGITAELLGYNKINKLSIKQQIAANWITNYTNL